MTIPLFIPGLILLLAGSHWFPGATTVGWVLVICGGAPIVFAGLLMALGLLATASRRRRLRRRYRGIGR